MSVSVEIVLALILVVLIRLSGCPSHLRNHPVLGPFFKVDPLYLDSLVEHLCLPPDEVVDRSVCWTNFGGLCPFQSLPCRFLETGSRPKSSAGVHLLISTSFSPLSSND